MKRRFKRKQRGKKNKEEKKEMMIPLTIANRTTMDIVTMDGFRLLLLLILFTIITNQLSIANDNLSTRRRECYKLYLMCDF